MLRMQLKRNDEKHGSKNILAIFAVYFQNSPLIQQQIMIIVNFIKRNLSFLASTRRTGIEKSKL